MLDRGGSVRYRMLEFDVGMTVISDDESRAKSAELWLQKVFRGFRQAHGPPQHAPEHTSATDSCSETADALRRGITVSSRDRCLHFTYDLSLRPSEKDAGFLTRVEEVTANYPVSRTINKIWVHAACLIDGDNLVLLVGPSGGGKTTLSLALSHYGLPLAADDVCLLDIATRYLVPYPRCPRIRNTAISNLQSMGVNLHSVAEILGQYVVLPADRFLSSACSLVNRRIFTFFLTRSENLSSGSSLVSVTTTEAVVQLTKYSNLLSQDPFMHFFDDVFRNASFHWLPIGDFRQNVDQVLGMIGKTAGTTKIAH